MAIGAAAHVQQIVAANNFCIRIGKNRKGVTGFPAEVPRDIRPVDADRDRTDACRSKFAELFFNSS